MFAGAGNYMADLHERTTSIYCAVTPKISALANNTGNNLNYFQLHFKGL